jgi:hypothetical protein
LEYKVVMIDGQPCLDTPIVEILASLEVGGALMSLTPLEYITARQRAWFKGILLPALAKDTGDSRIHWETKLKLAVLPDDFQPTPVAYGKQVIHIIPSIKTLGKRKMNQLIEGSVQHLRESPEYGDKFQWVTLPDSELRAGA